MSATTVPASATIVPAVIPAPAWDGFDLGPVTIHAYALCIIAGVVAALWLSSRRWRARGGEEGRVLDVALWAIPFGFVGGRLYHVFSSPDAYFGPGFDGTGDPIRILYVWEGGLGIWGAIALGAVGAWIGCRIMGIKLPAFADVVAPGVLLAQAIGRLGNYFNQELFGAPTTLPWGLQVDAEHPNFPDGVLEGTLFHPTFLYEMLWNLLGVAVLLLIDRRLRLRRGMMVWSYVAWYTAGRTWIEMLRIDDAQMITILGITQRLNVWTSLLLFIVAVGFLIGLALTRPRTPEARAQAESLYLPGREPAPAAETSGEVDETTETADTNEAVETGASVGAKGAVGGSGSTVAGSTPDTEVSEGDPEDEPDRDRSVDTGARPSRTAQTSRNTGDTRP